MTRLQDGKSVTRETRAMEHGKPLVVRLHARYIEIWRKGVREKYSIDYESVLALACKRAWERRRR